MSRKVRPFQPRFGNTHTHKGKAQELPASLLPLLSPPSQARSQKGVHAVLGDHDRPGERVAKSKGLLLP